MTENNIQKLTAEDIANIPYEKSESTGMIALRNAHILLIKTYAKQVAEQALSDAVNNVTLNKKATLMTVRVPSKHKRISHYSVNKESILNTEIKTP